MEIREDGKLYDEGFVADKKVVKRAENILNAHLKEDEQDTFENFIQRTKGGEEARPDLLEGARRALYIATTEEAQGKPESEAENLRTKAKIMSSGSEPSEVQRQFYLEQLNLVNENLEALGQEKINPPEAQRRFFVGRTKAHLGGSVRKFLWSDDGQTGDERFVYINHLLHPSVIRLVEFHELFHFAQAKDCLDGLQEGTASLYTTDLLKAKGFWDGYTKRSRRRSGYVLDELVVRSLQRLVGQRRLADLVFKGGAVAKEEIIKKGVPLDMVNRLLMRGDRLLKQGDTYNKKNNKIRARLSHFGASFVKSLAVVALAPLFLKQMFNRKKTP